MPTISTVLMWMILLATSCINAIDPRIILYDQVMTFNNDMQRYAHQLPDRLLPNDFNLARTQFNKLFYHRATVLLNESFARSNLKPILAMCKCYKKVAKKICAKLLDVD